MPPEFDPVLHVPARLKIAMLMAATTSASFRWLQDESALTSGNLAAHLRALEQAGYVESRRGLVDLRPRVRYQLTEAGRNALAQYCATLAQTVKDLQRLVPSAEVTRSS